MNVAPHDPDLTRPAQNGVYYVGHADLDRLAARARQEELAVCRIELAGCADKAALLDRMAEALALPADFGRNWDALADCLRDPAGMPAWGHVLLFAHAGDLRTRDRASFETLLGVLDDATTFAEEAERPCFAFLTLPEPENPMPSRTLSFELDRPFVKLDDLLKLTGIAASGGAGKQLVAGGEVRVDGAVELRKTCKIHAGQTVRVGNAEIHVTGNAP